jgi:hypothetical protein
LNNSRLNDNSLNDRRSNDTSSTKINTVEKVAVVKPPASSDIGNKKHKLVVITKKDKERERTESQNEQGTVATDPTINNSPKPNNTSSSLVESEETIRTRNDDEMNQETITISVNPEDSDVMRKINDDNADAF